MVMERTRKKRGKIPIRLETSRLIIRKYEKGDGSAFFSFLEKTGNRKHLKDHIDEATEIKTVKAAETRLQELVTDWEEQKRFVMGIWMKESAEYAGQIWIEVNKRESPSYELGWFLGYDLQGKGIATEAAKAAMKFIFVNLKAHKIIVLTRDDNSRSIKLVERCGFVLEGRLREHGIKDGKRFDLLYYGMLKKEYDNTKLTRS